MKSPRITRRCDCYVLRKRPARWSESWPEDSAKPDEWRKEGNGTTVVAAIREYLSDILGAFMPGVYFSVHLFISAVLFLFMINGLKWEHVADFISADIPVLRLAAPFAAFVFCFFSYIIGSVFYRKDTKEPDTASALRTYQQTDPDERKGLAFDFEKLQGSPLKLLTRLYMRINFRVDFPYPYLKRYLKTRNYTHLAEHIPWNGDNSASFKQRSKTFINILKIRIHRYAPEEMPEIEKNEAHIRLMNSLWYAAKSIRNITILMLMVATGLYVRPDLIARYNIISSGSIAFREDFAFCLGLFSIIQLIIAWYIRRSIKQYFHYMRVREIMFILEIADTVSRFTGKDLFVGLKEQAAEEKESGAGIQPGTKGRHGMKNHVV
jgi:hypothetical protein